MRRAGRQPKIVVTYLLILIEVIGFATTSAFGHDNLVYAFFGYSALGFGQGQFWSPITSLFIHANVFHLGINVFLLYVFGTRLEEESGSRFFAATFLLGGVLSLLVGIPLYSDNTKIVGSSIAVSAIIGASLVVIPERPSPVFLFRAPMGLVATVYLIFNAFYMFLGQTASGIAYASHVIGFFVGLCIAVLLWQGTRDKSQGPSVDFQKSKIDL